MNPGTFVRQLAALTPDLEALAAIGLWGADAEAFRVCCVCIPREVLQDRDSLDCAIALVDGWDASRVEIGAVQFDQHSSPSPLGTRVGVVEVDPLVVTSATGEVVVVDGDEPTYVMSYAAADGGKLLAALLFAEQFLNKRMFNEIDSEDFPAARSTAIECGVVAGGAKYERFYRNLLGAEP